MARQSVQSIASGKLDTMCFGNGPAMVTRGKGIELKVIAAGIVNQIAVIAQGELREYFDKHDNAAEALRAFAKDNWALAHLITDRHVGIFKNQLSIDQQRIMSWVAGDLMRDLGYSDLAEPLEMSDEDVALAVEMDGRFRAATLDAPHGWITFESYGDWLIDQREARRQAGIWSEHPDPAPFPIGRKYEEYYAGMRAMQKWKQHFAVKRDYTPTKSVL